MHWQAPGCTAADQGLPGRHFCLPPPYGWGPGTPLPPPSLPLRVADSCRLKITVLPETSAPDQGHKVKVMGLFVSDQPPRELSDSFMSWSLSQAQDALMGTQQAGVQQAAAQGGTTQAPAGGG